MHHIVSDGWSVGVLLRELWRAVRSLYLAGAIRSTPPLPIQYADYAQWQRRVAERDRLQAQGRYWQEQLAGAPQRSSLPSDRSRPAVQDYAGASSGWSWIKAPTGGTEEALSQRWRNDAVHDGAGGLGSAAGPACRISRRWLSGHRRRTAHARRRRG